mmetsp:Transcript_50878/g.131165  ORF Transcript_50878/g.131165 Transcript_50878/m.131165 type:complete len:857 (+) Transcript_50878:120-2690(+)
MPLSVVDAASAITKAGQGDDDDRLHDLDTKSITDPEDAKRKIILLRREQLREVDYQKRLRRKLTKLDEALAAKREEVESTQRTLQLEKGKEQSEKESAKREGGAKEKTQQEHILKALSEVIYTSTANSVGSKAPTTYVLDTVLVIYVRGKFKYPLRFRINDDTTIEMLRASSCKYWGVKNPDQFILVTMANNKCQDEVRVKECFKQGELAQLRLAEKNVESTAEPTEDERKAIQPKGGKKKKQDRGRGFDPAGADKQQKFSENYYSELKKLTGVYFLLRSRDAKPSDAASKVTCRDLIFYLVLACLSFYVYNARRPPGQDYWYIQGIEETMTRRAAFPMTDDFSDRTETYVPGFMEVSTKVELWDWLTYALPTMIWTKPSTIPMRDTSMSAFNMLLGFVSIRIQNVNSYGCKDSEQLASALNLTCWPRQGNDETRDTATMTDVETYWSQRPQYNDEIRGTESPAVWRSHEHNWALWDIGHTIGNVDTYDAGGYSAEFRFQLRNVESGIKQYTEDMKKLQELQWINSGTRVVTISFTLYNNQYDHWLACQMYIESPPAGALQPGYVFRPFKPSVSETRQELDLWYMDCVRLLIGMYIIIFVGYAERRHKIRSHKAGCWYHASLNGICDVGMVACLLCVVIWRSAEFESRSTAEYLEAAASRHSLSFQGYRSYADMAYDFETMYCVEGLLMMFLMFRMMNFTRMNYYVMVVKRTLGRAILSFLLFCAIFTPSLAGFVLIAHKVFGSTLPEYSLVSRTVIQMYRLGEGQLRLQGLMNMDVFGTMVLVVVFYAFMTFVLLNAFATVVVDAHYLVRLNSGGREKWDRSRWLTFALPTLVVNLASQVKQAIFPQSRDIEGMS